MGLTVLEPIRMVESLAGTQAWIYEENGVPKNFSGWSGDWRIAHQVDGDIATGTLSLSGEGRIVMTWTAAQADLLAEYATRRGNILPRVALEFEATNETDTLLFQAAVVWEARA
jgi:hypothetical protein